MLSWVRVSCVAASGLLLAALAWGAVARRPLPCRSVSSGGLAADLRARHGTMAAPHVLAPPIEQPATSGAALASDPRKADWGANASLSGAPPALLFFAPHKTGSTFFAAFMHDLAALLGLCWYTDNAAFMYAPLDHSKCASPSCGHVAGVPQRSFTNSDLGWGDCTGFTAAQLGVAAGCNATPLAQCEVPPPSARNGFLWGPLRLPKPMRAAAAQLRTGRWRWIVLLHQRHPLDALVSGYHSFGWTHPAAPSASAQQRRAHAARQSAVRNLSVDQYVMANVAGALQIRSHAHPHRCRAHLHTGHARARVPVRPVDRPQATRRNTHHHTASPSIYPFVPPVPRPSVGRAASQVRPVHGAAAVNAAGCGHPTLSLRGHGHLLPTVALPAHLGIAWHLYRRFACHGDRPAAPEARARLLAGRQAQALGAARSFR